MGRYARVRRLSAADSAYIAGIVDGEGTITLTTMHAGENRRLVVSVSSTERCLLEFLHDAAGAGIITSKRTYHDAHAPSYAFRVTNRQALDLLRYIAPYLRSYKRRRALLALRDYADLTPRNGRYSQATRLARSRFEKGFMAIGKDVESRPATQGRDINIKQREDGVPPQTIR